MAQVAHAAPRGEITDSGGSSNNGGSGSSRLISVAAAGSNAFDGAQLQQARVRVPNARTEYPLNVSVDFTQLRANALRRYMAFHRIPEPPGSSREQLAVAVARHFNAECQRADERTSIASFVSYVTSTREDESDALNAVRATGDCDDEARAAVSSRPQQLYDERSDASDSEPERDGAYDYYPNEREEDGDAHDDDDDDVDDDDIDDYDDEQPEQSELEPRAFAPRKRKTSSSDSSDAKTSKPTAVGKSSPVAGGGSSKKKKRKARVYCVCKGASFGNMIACDSKACLDRSNWYHMGCVGLDPSKDPPETWFCPACEDQDPVELPENQYRKPVASVTYGDMISHALSVLPHGKGSFKEICDFVEKQYESQLNWKLESDQRKSPVWKSSVRKILFSNMRFRKHPDDKGLFCLAA